MTLRCAILGPTGYTGFHLIDRLLRHPDAEVVYLASRRQTLPDIREVFPQLWGRMEDEVAQCQPIDVDLIAEHADVVFLGLPHKTAMEYVPQLLDVGLRVVDLSADYRLADAALYEQTYQTPHTDPRNLAKAVYGLPELFRNKLPGAQLVASPGCYPTAAALGIAPLLSHSLIKTDCIIINAASGVTGAGKKPTEALHFAQQNESYLAYGRIGEHRHQPEIEQTLSHVAGKAMSVLFVPHLLPVDHGILETIYLKPMDPEVTESELFEALEDAYADEPFVRVLEQLPNIKHVRDSNFCDVTVRLAGGTIIVFSAIDNMLKGASGQAIQCMNLMFGFDETAGLL